MIFKTVRGTAGIDCAGMAMAMIEGTDKAMAIIEGTDRQGLVAQSKMQWSSIESHCQILSSCV